MEIGITFIKTSSIKNKIVISSFYLQLKKIYSNQGLLRTMVVYEVGVISSAGLPVIHIDLRPEITGDPLMTAGFLTALQQFVNSTFPDEAQSFSMKKFAIFFSKIELLKEEASVYVICDRKKGN